MYGLFTFFLLLVIVFGIYVLNPKDNRWIWPMVGLKVMAAVCYVGVYVHYYQTGDVFVYEQISIQWSRLASEEYWYMFKVFFLNEGVTQNLLLQPRMLFFAKVFHLYYHAFFQNLYLVSIAMTLTGFVCWLGVYRILTNLMTPPRLLCWVLFVPTVLFATSGINKETLCVPVFFYLALVIKRLLDQNPLSGLHWVLVPISLFVLYHLRYFYFPFLMLWTMCYAISKYSNDRRLWVYASCFVLLGIVFQFILPHKLQVGYFGEQMFSNYHALASKSPVTSYLDLYFPDPSIWSVVLAMLQSIKGSFFLDFHSVFSTIASLENVLVLGALGYWFFYGDRLSVSGWLVLVVVVVMMAVLNTSTPNYGTLTRYRVIYWLPLIGIVLWEGTKKPFSLREKGLSEPAD